jgi:hypothetical protein
VLPLSDWVVNEIRTLMGISGASAYLLPRKNDLEPINPMLITRSVERLARRFQAVGIEPFTRTICVAPVVLALPRSASRTKSQSAWGVSGRRWAGYRFRLTSAT